MFFHENITKDFSRAKKFFEDIVAYTIGPYVLNHIIKDELKAVNIIDVRDYSDYIEGHIPYAVHIPYKEAENHIDMLPKDKINVIYSYNDSCPRSYKTALKLVEKHYPSTVLRGGFKLWKKFDFDIIKNDTNDYKEFKD